MEDMKGKIRVYARVRPMLGLEYEKGQCVALAIPDELSVSHYWRNESKPREYSFDKVFDPDSTQDDVSAFPNKPTLIEQGCNPLLLVICFHSFR